MSTSQTSFTPPVAEETIVCGCTALSLAEIRRRIAEKRDMAFEELLAATDAGTKCTACLLDLEYYFVAAQQERSNGAALDRTVGQHAASTKVGLKQRLYRWIDRCSPKVAYPFNNPMPILYGVGIEQWLWITNRSMMFEGKDCAPVMRIELTIRDSGGRTVGILKRDIARESMMRYQLSAHFADAGSTLLSGQIGIGSVEIRRKGLRAGIRGTTRPQIEILTTRAACAVHSQALTGPGQYWFSCLLRPKHERIFFSILNGASKQATIELIYPVGEPGIEPVIHRIVLPGHGATLHEMRLADTTAQKIGENRPISVTWRAAMAHKLHAICATPTLDRLSIDHL